MTKPSRPNIEKLFQEARHYSSIGEITHTNDTLRKIREHDSSLATEEQLLVLMREGYRNCMKICLTSAAGTLEGGIVVKAIKKLLDMAKYCALELNGRDVRDFLANGLPLYQKLDELRRARA